MSASICLSEVISMLQDEGYSNAVSSRIHHAMSAGYVKRPEKDRSGQYRWTAKDLRSLRKYLANVPRPGRRSAAAV